MGARPNPLARFQHGGCVQPCLGNPLKVVDTGPFDMAMRSPNSSLSAESSDRRVAGPETAHPPSGYFKVEVTGERGLEPTAERPIDEAKVARLRIALERGELDIDADLIAARILGITRLASGR